MVINTSPSELLIGGGRYQSQSNHRREPNETNLNANIVSRIIGLTPLRTSFLGNQPTKYPLGLIS